MVRPAPRGISHYFKAEGEQTNKHTKQTKTKGGKNATAETDAGTKPKTKKQKTSEACNKVPTHGKRHPRRINLKKKSGSGAENTKNTTERPKARRMLTPKPVILSCPWRIPKAQGESLATVAGRSESDPGPCSRLGPFPRSRHAARTACGAHTRRAGTTSHVRRAEQTSHAGVQRKRCSACLCES